VIETEFLFQLLMGLFTNPARLDGLASTDVVENQHDMECVAVV
jgi:hypothetical protein